MPTAAAWSNTRRHASEHVAPSARTISDVLEPGRDGAGFNANDRILNETADRLSRQEESDIDQLVPRAGDAGVPDLQGAAGRGAADALPVPAAGAGASAGAGRIGPGRRRA